MKLQTLPASKVKKGTRILMRVDLNVPLVGRRIAAGGDGRLRAVVPDIEAYAARGAKVILVSHLGRPAGKKVRKLSLKPVAAQLKKRLTAPVTFTSAVVGASVVEAVDAMENGSVLVLENVRFEAGEEKNLAGFAKQLAVLADVYVNNAFGVCHRAHASVVAITKYLPSYAGPAVVREVRELTKRMPKPLMVIVGGNKIETKVDLIKRFKKDASMILVGSGLKDAMQSHAMASTKIVTPIDAKRAKGRDADIGPETIALYSRLLSGARGIIWNGPLGVIEKVGSRKGTKAIAGVVTSLSGARTIVGGGDTIAFIERLGLADQFTFVSTGGGAMLALLSGKKLPGLEPLKKK